MATKKSSKKAAKKAAARKPAKTAKKPAKAAPKKATRKPAKAPAKRAAKRVSHIPKGAHTANAYLVIRGVGEALEFYAKALGAKETMRMSRPDGGVMHAEMRIGDSVIMLSDENPQWGAMSPLSLGGNATHVMLYVPDVDALVSRASAAGAIVEMAPGDQFWGDRYGKIKDPFGHSWSVATHIEDVGPKEMRRRAEEFARQMAVQQAQAG